MFCPGKETNNEKEETQVFSSEVDLLITGLLEKIAKLEDRMNVLEKKVVENEKEKCSCSEM